jgi:hypothetical protein
VSDCDEAETRLPVEELLLSAEAGVIVSGTEAATYCFNGLPEIGEVLRVRSTDGGSEDVSAEPGLGVDMLE